MLTGIRKLVGRFFGRDTATASRSERELADLQDRYAKLRGSYDAARTSDEFKNYWANSDRLSADAANSREVRHTLISRSRYEAGNNAYSDGIAQTITNDLIGNGPTLRMQTASEGFNRTVELSWFLWSNAIDLRRKLWCMAHAKHVDGESFGVLRRNPKVKHPVPMDVVLYEAEQIQSPYPSIQDGEIDGITFDTFGNPTSYELLQRHPGDLNGYSFENPERIPADMMLHWFRMRRPGQHRGVPEMASSLNAGAAARRWREATLSAAERAALLTMMMETNLAPEEADAVAPFSTMDVEKGLMNFLPMGWKPNFQDAKFPSATHTEFNKQLINEMGRAVNMPRNKAACDSSDYNYASGRLDHGTYYDSLDIQRVDCNERVLDPAFSAWFRMAVGRLGWLGGDPENIGSVTRFHTWDWPKHRVADVEAEANASQTKLKSGQVFPHTIFTDAGLDFEDELEKASVTFGVPADDLRKRLLDVILPPVQQGGAPGQSAPTKEVVAAILRDLGRNGNHVLNGAGHG
jgi:capsid protein